MNDSSTLLTLNRISAGAVVIGIALLIYMVTVESEPGAIPLLLILLGVVGYLVTRTRLRSDKP